MYIIVLKMLQLDPNAEVEHCSRKSLHNFGLSEFFSLMRFNAKKRSDFSNESVTFIACIIIMCITYVLVLYVYDR